METESDRANRETAGRLKCIVWIGRLQKNESVPACAKEGSV